MEKGGKAEGAAVQLKIVGCKLHIIDHRYIYLYIDISTTTQLSRGYKPSKSICFVIYFWSKYAKHALEAPVATN